MKFSHAFLAIGLVIVVHAIALSVNAYQGIPELDVPMHFAGGFVMGMLGLAIHTAITDKHHVKQVPYWYHLLFVLGFAMSVGVAWEFFEYILDNTLVIWYNWAPNQLSLGDTMMDFVFDAFGAVAAFVAFQRTVAVK